MLKVTGNGSITTCDGITRRDFLQVGTLGAIGLTMSKYAALQSLAGLPFGRIILWVVAAGLIIYGVFCFARARYARM